MIYSNQEFVRQDMHMVYVKPPHPLDELLNVTIDETLDWDPVVNFRKTTTQTDALYKEQPFCN